MPVVQYGFRGLPVNTIGPKAVYYPYNLKITMLMNYDLRDAGRRKRYIISRMMR